MEGQTLPSGNGEPLRACVNALGARPRHVVLRRGAPVGPSPGRASTSCSVGTNEGPSIAGTGRFRPPRGGRGCKHERVASPGRRTTAGSPNAGDRGGSAPTQLRRSAPGVRPRDVRDAAQGARSRSSYRGAERVTRHGEDLYESAGVSRARRHLSRSAEDQPSLGCGPLCSQPRGTKSAAQVGSGRRWHCRAPTSSSRWPTVEVVGPQARPSWVHSMGEVRRGFLAGVLRA